MASAREMTSKIKATASIVYACFRHYGLHLNFKKGKTEALIQWAGKGAVEARRALEQTSPNGICFVSCNVDLVLHVVKDYRHLGTRMAAAGHMGAE
eukprot:4020348-Karenia_brevis.AAC.1